MQRRLRSLGLLYLTMYRIWISCITCPLPFRALLPRSVCYYFITVLYRNLRWRLLNRSDIVIAAEIGGETSSSWPHQVCQIRNSLVVFDSGACIVYSIYLMVLFIMGGKVVQFQSIFLTASASVVSMFSGSQNRPTSRVLQVLCSLHLLWKFYYVVNLGDILRWKFYYVVNLHVLCHFSENFII